MHVDALRVVAFLGLSAFLAGCSGGGSSTAGTLKVPCTSSASKFCLASCNLGCSEVGCSITEIAQNQQITLGFSLPIDPASVSGSSVSLKTAAGEPPAGSISVQGQNLTFTPEIRIVGGATQFGFRANETYILTLPGGVTEQQALRSSAGQVLADTISCTLRVTRGIVDPDGQPPTVAITTPDPASTGSAPRDTQIVLEFSEYIDVSPFIGASSATSPVQYRIRRTRLDGNGKLICDPAAPAVTLEGVPRATLDTATQKTQVVLKPSIRLPSLVCVEVEVTNRVRDLSGKAVAPTLFTFFTEAAASDVLTIDETFTTEAQLDKEQSSGSWSGSGVFGPIGGDGLLGDFDPTDGTFLAPNIYIWSTDSQVIKKPVLTGVTPPLSPVTDGVFRFSNFKLPRNTIVDFRGSRIPRILVRGSLEIAGTVRVNGINLTPVTASNAVGQVGSAGGPGAGKGGQGGDRGDGLSNGGGAYSGRPGEDVKLPVGHAYASRAVGTGGRGGLQFPASGRNADVTFRANSNAICGMVPAGGAGGGNASAGSTGKATNSPSLPTKELGPDSIAGIAFDPFPLPSGTLTFDHFLFGGSGGGGGGSHVFFSSSPTPKWSAGGGGAGGGGAIGIRVGRDLTLTSEGRLEARGGDGVSYGVAQQPLGPPTAGGGGSGGAIVLQVGGSIFQSGLIDASGGKKSLWDLSVFGAASEGGDGSPGLIRLEMPTAPSPALLGNTVPSASTKNVDSLRESDNASGFQSKWYSTRLLFAPTYQYYVVQATDGASTLTYSDDAARGIFAGYGQGQPITVLVQGAKVNATTGVPEPTSIGPWRQYVGPFNGGNNLNADGPTGFRFLVLVNRAVAPNLVLKKFTVGFRE